MGAALRGGCWGIAAGALWVLTEVAVGWGAGSFAPPRLIGIVALLDVALAGAVGVLARLAWPSLAPERLAVVLSLAYGFLRVVAPPGPAAELSYLAVAPIALIVAGRMVPRGEPPAVAFGHVVVLGALGLLAWECWQDRVHAPAPGGAGLLLSAMAPGIVALAADRVLAFAVRTRPRRMLVEAALAAAVLTVWGTPLDTAPLRDPSVTAPAPPSDAPDVILVSWDTARADHLSTYGYTRDTSPNLTAFARDARLYRYARSTAGWTLPGHASMLTGLFPVTHGARLSGTFLGTESIDGRRNVAYPLAPEHTTLAEILRDRGYQTAAFVANYAYLHRDYGLAQGFATYDDAPGLLLRVRPPALRLVQQFVPGFFVKSYRSGRLLNGRALAWLDHAPPGRPVFLFINYMDAHHPWYAEPPFDRWTRTLPGMRWIATKNLETLASRPLTPDTLAYISASYDGQLASADDAFGELLAGLRARGRYENALIVMTADHGELLGEHGLLGHIGRMLWEPLLRIPLVVKHPGADRPRDVVDAPVQLVDIVPTVAQEAGARLPAEVEGVPLDTPGARPALAQEWIAPSLVSQFGEAYNRTVRVVVEGGYKLIATSRGERMLFDLARDPAEERDLAAAEPQRVEDLAHHLDAKELRVAHDTERR